MVERLAKRHWLIGVEKRGPSTVSVSSALVPSASFNTFYCNINIYIYILIMLIIYSTQKSCVWDLNVKR